MAWLAHWTGRSGTTCTRWLVSNRGDRIPLMTKRALKIGIPKVGAKVTLKFGGREVHAVVVEDRGPLGVGGRQILRVRVLLEDGDEPIEFELPATDVQMAA